MTEPRLTVQAELAVSPEVNVYVAAKLDEYLALKQAIADLERNAAEIKEDIQASFDGGELDGGITVEGHGKAKMVYPTVAGKLDVKRLVSLGVTMTQIERATGPDKPGKAYLLVSSPGKGKLA